MVRCGTVHTCSHTRFIDRFMVSEGSDPWSLPFTSKTGQSHSVAQNRQTSIKGHMGQAKQKCVLEQNFAKFRFFLNSVEYHLSSI